MYILEYLVDEAYENTTSNTVAVSASVDALKAEATKDNEVYDQKWSEYTVNGGHTCYKLILADSDYRTISYCITEVKLV